VKVSVVIPAKNGRPTIGPCLDAVEAQEVDAEVEVLVIDSGSTDGTLDEVRARPRVRLHRIPPLAFDHGDTRNLGAGMTDGELVVFLVQDAEPTDRHWLAHLVENFADERVAGAFSRILPRPEAGPLVKIGCEGDLCFGTERVESRMESREAWAALDPHALRVACNFNDVSSAVRRSAWQRLPLARGMFGEDIKFARAAIEAGWTIVFDPRSRVWHSHEYDRRTVYSRTFIDARMNREELGRTCIASARDALIMTGRSWRNDRERLARMDLPALERLRWSALSPVYHLGEFWGFWRGGLGEAARRPAIRATDPGPLRILYVVHGFPPESWAGTEVLSLTLARAMRARGHEVALFVRSPGGEGRDDLTTHRDDFDGFPVHRFVNRLTFGGVDETYRFAPAEAAFDRVLAQVRPDVVHVQHHIHLSTGIVDRARDAGLPVVLSQPDYWSRCPRVQLIRPDRSNCVVPPPGLGCAACVKDRPAWIGPLTALSRVADPLLRAWARTVPQSRPAPPPGPRKSREDAASLLRREGWMRGVLRRADLVCVPSATVLAKLMEFGLPRERLAWCEWGLDRTWLPDERPPRRARAPGEPLQVGFLGTIVWYKGLATLARAVAALGPSRAHLHVHGDHEGGGDPLAAAVVRDEVGAVRGVFAAAGHDNVTWHGRYDHDDLFALLHRLDVLVVPSLWQEAYGLTVREGFLAGLPVVGSDIAGISEGIEHDRSGLLFSPGDAEDLARQLRRLYDDPALGPRLAAGAPRVRTDAEEAVEMEWRYRQVIGRRRGVATRP